MRTLISSIQSPTPLTHFDWPLYAYVLFTIRLHPLSPLSLFASPQWLFLSYSLCSTTATPLHHAIRLSLVSCNIEMWRKRNQLYIIVSDIYRFLPSSRTWLIKKSFVTMFVNATKANRSTHVCIKKKRSIDLIYSSYRSWSLIADEIAAMR